MAAKKKGGKRVAPTAAATRALVTVSLTVHKQLRQYAANHDTTVKAAVEAAVKEFLSKEGGKQG